MNFSLFLKLWEDKLRDPSKGGMTPGGLRYSSSRRSYTSQSRPESDAKEVIKDRKAQSDKERFDNRLKDRAEGHSKAGGGGPKRDEDKEVKEIIADRPKSEEAPKKKDQEFDAKINRRRSSGKETRPETPYVRGRGDKETKKAIANPKKSWDEKWLEDEEKRKDKEKMKIDREERKRKEDESKRRKRNESFSVFCQMVEATKDRDEGDPKRRLINKSLEKGLKHGKHWTSRHMGSKGEPTDMISAPAVKDTIKKKDGTHSVYKKSHEKKKVESDRKKAEDSIKQSSLERSYKKRNVDAEKEKTGVHDWHTQQHDGEIKPERMTPEHKKAVSLEKNKDKKSKGHPKIEEGLFTDFLNDQHAPLYEVLGKDNKMPKCPVGYKWNNMTMRCEPKTERDSVAGDKGQKMPHGQAHYNVIGSSGYDGGWAFQEPPTSMDMNPDH
jgi:hypothetical protein